MKPTRLLITFIAVIIFLLPGIGNAKTSSKTVNNQTVKVLTIGNSFADNACKYLKQITESVDGCNIVIEKANIGGCYLEKHANLIKESESDPTCKPYNGKSLKERLLQDNWDVVTIQQVSHMSFKPETYHPYVDEIISYIKKYAPQARIYIHETWAYAPDCPRLDGFGISSKQMYKGLKKNYRTLSKQNDFPILPSGDAFYKAHKKNKEMNLWNENDRFHANENGCYLAGCVWFSKLFNRSPEEVKYVPEEISAETAGFIRKIATL